MIIDCEICDKEIPDYDPQMCCNGHMCGCMGQPNNPPVCSDECYEVFIKLIESARAVKNEG